MAGPGSDANTSRSGDAGGVQSESAAIRWPHPFADVMSVHHADPPRRVVTLHAGIAADAEDLERCAKQNRILGSLAEPRILCASEVKRRDDGRLVLTGGEAKQPVAATLLRTAVTVDRVVGILIELCGALDAAQGLGFQHGALTLGSVFADPRAPSPGSSVTVADFGIGESLEVDGLSDGAARWLPLTPEKVLGMPRGPAEDVYLVGAVGFALLSGVSLFSGTTVRRVARSHAIEDPPELHRLSLRRPVARTLSKVINHCLCKEPDDRFEDPAALASALQAVRAHPEPARPVASTRESPERLRARARARAKRANALPSLLRKPLPRPTAKEVPRPPARAVPAPPVMTAAERFVAPPGPQPVTARRPTLRPPSPPVPARPRLPPPPPGKAVKRLLPPRPEVEPAHAKPSLDPEPLADDESAPLLADDDVIEVDHEVEVPVVVPVVTDAAEGQQRPQPKLDGDAAPERRRRRLGLMVAAALALAAGGVGALALGGDDPEPSTDGLAHNDPLAPDATVPPRASTRRPPDPVEARAPIEPEVEAVEPAQVDPAPDAGESHAPARAPADADPVAADPEPPGASAPSGPEARAVGPRPNGLKRRRANELSRDAAAARRAGDIGGAVRLYRQALALRPGLASAAYGLCVINFNKGRYAEAARNCKAAVRSAPRRAEYRLRLGDVYHRMQRRADARAEWQKAAKHGSEVAQKRLGKSS